MFSPPLRRSSPGLDLPSVFRLSSHDLDRSREDAQIASRPCLKRQATAPHPTVLTKKKRETSLLPDYTTLWSDEVHAAFLEALQKHPLSSTWRLDETFEDAPDDEQAVYCRIIQNYILSKTGLPQTVEQISEQINLVLSSPSELATPLLKTPAENKAVFPESGKEIGFAFYDANKDNFLGLNAEPRSCKSRQSDLNTVRSNETASMSRRRKACNRPILNLRVDLPPVSGHFGLDISPTTESCGTSDLTPCSAFSLHVGQSAGPRDGLNPMTPLDQCHKNPLAPPEIPRVVNTHRRAVGRWIPTPTEGVLPSLSCASSVSSPLSTTSPESSSESSSNDSSGSNSTEHMQSRPRLSGRNLSWLSMPQQASELHD